MDLSGVEIVTGEAAGAIAFKFGYRRVIGFLSFLIVRELRVEFFRQLFMTDDAPLKRVERRFVEVAQHGQFGIDLFL